MSLVTMEQRILEFIHRVVKKMKVKNREVI